MISGVAFCPQPPLLVPEVASGAADELDGLRAACRAAIATVCGGRRPVLLGAGPVSLAHSSLSRGTLAAFGVPGEIGLDSSNNAGRAASAGVTGGQGGALELPPSLTVGAWLLGDALGAGTGARAFSVGKDFATSRAAVELLQLAETADVGLVVLGDGSARRSTSAPGYLDERAAAFDADVAAALRSGDGARLGQLDGELAADLLAGGVPAWHAAAAVLADVGRDAHLSYDAQLSYDGAPYGVGYFVATWLPR